MALLVHIAPAKLEAQIRRGGLKPGAWLWGGRFKSSGVYAFPVLESHTLTHQWTRELMKWRRQPMIGVYFRLPDDELVEFGHYQKWMRKLPLAQAIGAIRAAPDQRGFQIVVTSEIKPRTIQRIAPVRGVVGWRHFPDAHQRKPCGCPACVGRGEPGGRKLRERYESGER